MATPRNQGIQYDSRLLAGWSGSPSDAAVSATDGSPGRDELLSILRCMDLTTLNGDDTHETVKALCQRAVAPVPGEKVAAVCVYPVFVRQALTYVEGSGVRVATVAAAFPHGLSPLDTRVAEVEAARELGAQDIDIVIQRAKAICGEWADLYREVRLFRQACGGAHLKVILATGELKDPETIYKASMTAMMAGADFIKTSTGKEATNATPEVASVMLQAIADYKQATGAVVGFKPAGGVRTAAQAAPFVRLSAEAMGEDYVAPATFRIGASSLLDDVVQALS